jgi:hypothetical protein
MAMQMYGSQNKGFLPCGNSLYDGVPSSRTIDSTAARGKPKNQSSQWEGLGLLFATKCCPSGQVFYCPERAIVGDGKSEYRGKDWIEPYANKIDNLGYLYRYFGEDDGKGYIPGPEQRTLRNLRLGRLTHTQYDSVTFSGKVTAISKIMALTCDLMGTRGLSSPLADWAHDNPWGACVGYSDGHADFVAVEKKIALIPQNGVLSGQWDPADQSKAMEYIWRMFRAYDINDFTDVKKTYSSLQ